MTADLEAGRLRVLVHGAAGRMGRAVVAQLADAPGLALGAAVDRGDDLPAALASSDVVVDFSARDAVVPLLEAAARARKPVVVCTTGLGPNELAAVGALAAVAPVLVAANTSVGVAVLAHLAARAAALLGPDYDVEIVEMHHRHKVDAPSGTALRLAEAVAGARDVAVADVARHGRAGQVGPRPPGEIGMHALRGGDVIGEHTVVLAGPAERVELTHRATSRDLFASGALRLAAWLGAPGRSPGRYTVEQALGIAG
jgi:4-hydroxy-tetrahydrodipicolinate reductase